MSDAISVAIEKALSTVQQVRAADGDDRKSLMTAICKIDEAKRVVFGAVLIPDVVDSQGDTIDADTIRNAALGFMEQFRRVGIMHTFDASSLVQIVESWIAPSDFELDGHAVTKGTWLMSHRINDDSIWSLILDGSITGFSIGGVARRIPL